MTAIRTLRKLEFRSRGVSDTFPAGTLGRLPTDVDVALYILQRDIVPHDEPPYMVVVLGGRIRYLREGEDFERCSMSSVWIGQSPGRVRIDGAVYDLASDEEVALVLLQFDALGDEHSYVLVRWGHPHVHPLQWMRRLNLEFLP